MNCLLSITYRPFVAISLYPRIYGIWDKHVNIYRIYLIATKPFEYREQLINIINTLKLNGKNFDCSRSINKGSKISANELKKYSKTIIILLTLYKNNLDILAFLVSKYLR